MATPLINHSTPPVFVSDSIRIPFTANPLTTAIVAISVATKHACFCASTEVKAIVCDLCKLAQIIDDYSALIEFIKQSNLKFTLIILRNGGLWRLLNYSHDNYDFALPS
jgi:hypothetical protein